MCVPFAAKTSCLSCFLDVFPNAGSVEMQLPVSTKKSWPEERSRTKGRLALSVDGVAEPTTDGRFPTGSCSARDGICGPEHRTSSDTSIVCSFLGSRVVFYLCVGTLRCHAGDWSSWNDLLKESGCAASLLPSDNEADRWR